MQASNVSQHENALSSDCDVQLITKKIVNPAYDSPYCH